MNELEESRAAETDAVLRERFADQPEKRGPGRPPKDKIAEVNSALAKVWTDAVCAAIVSKQVLSAADVEKAVPIADAVVEAYKVRFVGP